MRLGKEQVPTLGRYQSMAMAAAILGIIGLVVGYTMNAKVASQSFFYGFIFWLGLTLGCFGLTVLYHATHGKWGSSVLRILEAGNKVVPVMFVFALLVLLNLKGFYPWANAETLKAGGETFEQLIHHKAWWLNPVFFCIRIAVYFAIWLGLSNYLNRSTAKQEKTGDENEKQKRSNLAAPGLVIHVVVITFAMIDLCMSLEPGFFSTIFGAWYMIGQTVLALSFTTILTIVLSKQEPFSKIINPQLTRDLGNLMLGFTMLWAYFSLSQWLIIWSANQSEETIFFATRNQGAMTFVGGLIIICQFFIPFLCLLSGKTKREPKLLLRLAIWIFCMRAVDLIWVLLPAFPERRGGNVLTTFQWTDIAGFLAVGGVWLFMFLRNLGSNTLVTTIDKRLKEVWENA